MATAETNNDRFKLPGSSLDEVFKVVQGYATFAKAGSLADIAKNTGMHKTSISKNVGFLLSLGILEGGRNKSSTEVGKKLGLALMHNVPEEVESILADIVAEDEFLKNVLAAVRIRKGMDETSLRSHIAYSAGLSKTGSTTTGTGAVVELLKRSGHLKAEDGKLVVSSPIARAPSNEAVPTQERAEPARVQSVTRTIETTCPFSISIKIEVRCEPQDLDDLGLKLRKVVDDFSKQAEADETGED
jgi:DNA-binding phage protein